MSLSKEKVCKSLGKKLRIMRIEKGYTLEGLANDANLDYSQLSRIELGKINTSVYQIYKISFHLNIPMNEFFNEIHH